MNLRERAAALERDTFALYLSIRDPSVGWLPRLLGGAVLAYAASPIDLVPDFIPVLGYLDDLLIVPAGIAAVRRLIPDDLFEAHRAAADERLSTAGRGRMVAAGLIVFVWSSVPAVILWRVLS